jgi:hypothetical protein
MYKRDCPHKSRSKSRSISPDRSVSISYSRSLDKSRDNDKKCDFQKKCKPIEYILCDEQKKVVPVVVKSKLFVPKCDGIEIKKGKKGDCLELCGKYRGLELCSKKTEIVDGLLLEKVFGPHFKKDCPPLH